MRLRQQLARLRAGDNEAAAALAELYDAVLIALHGLDERIAKLEARLTSG